MLSLFSLQKINGYSEYYPARFCVSTYVAKVIFALLEQHRTVAPIYRLRSIIQTFKFQVSDSRFQFPVYIKAMCG
jgi:hypothetical protein